MVTKLGKVVNVTDRLQLLKSHDLHVGHITTAKRRVNNESVRKTFLFTLHSVKYTKIRVREKPYSDTFCAVLTSSAFVSSPSLSVDLVRLILLDNIMNFKAGFKAKSFTAEKPKFSLKDFKCTYE